VYIPHVPRRVQVIFDLQTLFRLSGVVTQARWNHTPRPTRSRSHTKAAPPSFAKAFLR